MKLSIIGTGYVGLVTGTCFAEMGHKVYCVDIDKKKIDNLKNNILPIYEPNLKELVIENQEKGDLIFTTNIKKALNNSSIVFIAVGTPMNDDGTANLKFVEAVSENIAESINHDMIIVMKSTVPVGTCHKIKNKINKILKKRKSNVKIEIVSNPEFLKEGVAIEDCMHPDRIVIGAENEKTFSIMKELYSSFVINHERFILMDIKSSELTKYAANSMLATRISFMNEIANICEKTGANIKNIRQGIGSDTRIGYDFLYAGCGYGGSCFPKDIQALINTAKSCGYEPKLLKNVEAVNQDQKQIIIKKIINKFGEDLNNLTFGIWGLSFKPGTDDIREAPSLTIITELVDRGAKIQAYDPQATSETKSYFEKKESKYLENIKFVDRKLDALNNVDSLILITEWKEFRNIDYSEIQEKMKRYIIFDGRNIYNKEVVEREGFELYQIGC